MQNNNLGTVKVKYSFGLGGNLLLLAGAGALAVHGIKKLVDLDNSLKANAGVRKASEAINCINELMEKFKEAEIVKEESEENTEDAEEVKTEE